MLTNLLQRRLTVSSILSAAFLLISQASAAFDYSHPVTTSLASVPDNTWVRVDQGSVTSPGNIMSYSGGWYDAENHQFCIFGGGHWDYSGNEVWCFDIATLNWQRMYAPDVVTTQGGNQGAYNNYNNSQYPGALFNPAGESIADANPFSKHTYDQMEFVEGLGPVIWGGYSWGDGSTTGWCVNCKDTWAFKYNTAKWQYLYDGTNPSPNITAGVGSSAYSTADKLLYVVAYGNTWTYNPTNNRWTQISTSGNAPGSIEMTMEYDSRRNVLYTFGGTWPDNPNLYRFNIASRTWTRLTPNGAGPDVSTVRGPGLAYDEANDVLLVYKNGTIWAYNPNNNSWSTYTSAGSPAGDGWDVYGRFRYDPINNGFWYHSMTGGQHTTWFYRFSNDGTPPVPNPSPTVTFNATPMSVQQGGQTALTWTSNADSCSTSGDWSDSVGTNGTSTKTLTETSTFGLTCTLNGVNTVSYVTVQVTTGTGGGGTPPPNPDSDADGLPDAWELQYFGDLLSDGNDDNDQDGFSNWVEYNQGSNPTVWDAPAPPPNNGGGSGGDTGSGGAAPTEGSNNTISAGAFNIFDLFALLMLQLVVRRVRHRKN